MNSSRKRDARLPSPPHATRCYRRRLTNGLFAGTALLLAAPTPAQADEIAERPATWDLSVEELQAIGLGQSRGDPVPVPDDAPLRHAPDEPQPAKQGAIFVNFDGANLSSGWDDSRTNTTQLSNLVGQFAAYGAGTKRDATLQAVRSDWQAYNVTVTDSRPASGDYAMNMTGPTNPYGGGILGIAPLDCNDSETHNNITFAFHSSNDSMSASTHATTIGQEVAHGFGLEHVDEPGDIMNPYNAGGDASFIDQCLPVTGGASCGSQHAAECGSSYQQNSHAELTTLFGPSMPDNQSPVVEITFPLDGATFEPGANFVLTVEANDDNAVSEVVLFNNGQEMQRDGSAPYGWEVTDIPKGTYDFHVIAVDQAGNDAQSNSVTIGVGEAPTTTGGSGDDSDSGGSDGGDDGDSAGDDGAFTTGGDALPPGFGQEAEVEGCACTQQRESGRFAVLLLLAAAGTGFARRRGR